MTENASLAGLFASSFLSATVLPGSSEAVLTAVLLADTARLWPALLVATLGNTLGGLTSYGLGRVAPTPRNESRSLTLMKRYGAPALLLSWVPIVGDALCVAAGWLRFRVWQCAAFIAVGKFIRYLAVAMLVERVADVALR